MNREYAILLATGPGMVMQVDCLICGGKIRQATDNTFVGFQQNTITPEVQIPSYLVLVFGTCAECGVKVQSPRMPDEAIDAYYRTGIYRDFISVPQSPEEREEKQAWRPQYAYNLLRENPPESLTHLDFGGDTGLMGSIMTENANYASFLVEVNPESREYAEKVHEIPSFNELPRPELKFGSITALEVIEHIGNPVNLLSELYSRLEDGGTLVISVPENNKDYPIHYSLHHLHVFTENSLKELAKQAEIVETLRISRKFNTLFMAVTRRKI